MRVADEASLQGVPVLRMADPRAEDAQTEQRYQRQLGLSMSAASRLLGPRLVRSVALTGSDTYFPTGTDVAVLFESPQPAVLENLILAQVGMAAAKDKEAQPIKGEVAGASYQGFLSPDRRISSYVARLNGVVVVANSAYPVAAAGRSAKRQVALDCLVAGVCFLPRPLPPGPCRRNGPGLPQRRHDPPLVRAEVADRQLPPHPRRRRAGRAAGLAGGRPGP